MLDDATITTTGLASPIEYALTLTDYLSPAPHVSSVAEICSWIVRRPQAPRGDVLIFGKSAAHRDELTRELTIAIGCWSPYTVTKGRREQEWEGREIESEPGRNRRITVQTQREKVA